MNKIKCLIPTPHHTSYKKHSSDKFRRTDIGRFLFTGKIWVIGFYFLIVGTEDAHAYLDPGTGNALIYVVVSLIGAVAYAVKSAFYKIVRWKKTSVSVKTVLKKETRTNKKTERSGVAPVVLLNDGNSRDAFMSVIDKLIEKGTPFVILPLTAQSVDNNAYLKTNFAEFINGGNEEDERDRSLVIFSEGKNYWGTYKPIIEALLAKGQPFTYYSMDIHDPALTIENDLMTSKYIGKGTMAFAKMNRVEANILLTTTPNIGTANYPIKKSAKVRSLIHVWHSFGDYTYAWYHHGSLDSFDQVLTAGDYMDPQIRLTEQKRGLKTKKLVALGVPYLDGLAKERAGMTAGTDGKTILIAPSWGTKGCLTVYGVDFIRDLAKADFNVIVRPHPQSLKVEKDKIDGFKRDLSEFPNVVWDERVDGSVSMAKADLMISDTSSARMDFFVLYKRPVITLEMPVSDTTSYEYEDLKELLAQSTMETDIGDKVAMADIGRIVECVKTALSSTADRDFDALTVKYAVNFGHAGEAVADYLIAELNK